MYTTDEERDALIERWLGNKLGTAERAAFEIRLLEDPELLEQVQLAEALRVALVQEGPTLASAISTSNVLPFRAWLRQPLSLAASVLVAALGVQLVYTGLSRAPEGSGIAVGSLLLLEATRGAAPPAFSGQAPYLFQIDSGFGNQAETFTVTVRDVTADTVVLAQDGLRADPDGWVRLLFVSAMSGEYVVDLHWTDPEGQMQTRRFPVLVTPVGQ